MKWKDEKIVGYALLATGVIMIFFSIYQMIVVFTGGSPPPKLFNFSDISTPVVQGQNVLLMSGQDLSQLVAMAFWEMLMLFIMWAGGKIASLGVDLIREIRVEIKARLPGPLSKIEEETGKTEEKKESSHGGGGVPTSPESSHGGGGVPTSPESSHGGGGVPTSPESSHGGGGDPTSPEVRR